jgi:type VI secretion system Hcp family effector
MSYGYVAVDGWKGSNTRKGMPAGSSLMTKFDLRVYTPFDPGAGAVTQSRIWGTANCRTVVDAATYQFYTAIKEKDTNAAAKPLKVTFGFYRPDQPSNGMPGKGDQQEYYIISLEGAYVVDVKYGMEEVSMSSTGGGGVLGDFLEVAFIYHKITGKFVPGSNNWDDSWGK